MVALSRGMVDGLGVRGEWVAQPLLLGLVAEDARAALGGSVRRRGGDGGSNGVALVGRVCWLLLGPGRGRRDAGMTEMAGVRGCGSTGSPRTTSVTSGRGQFANRPYEDAGIGGCSASRTRCLLTGSVERPWTMACASAASSASSVSCVGSWRVTRSSSPSAISTGSRGTRAPPVNLALMVLSTVLSLGPGVGALWMLAKGVAQPLLLGSVAENARAAEGGWWLDDENGANGWHSHFCWGRGQRTRGQLWGRSATRGTGWWVERGTLAVSGGRIWGRWRRR